MKMLHIVELPYNGPQVERMNWCRISFGPTGVNWLAYIVWSNNTVVWKFKKEEDAILFALTWI
jgi:hypothetical protein